MATVAYDTLYFNVPANNTPKIVREPKHFITALNFIFESYARRGENRNNGNIASASGKVYQYT